MRLSAIPNKLLAVLGLKVIPLGSAQKRFPVEIDASDQAVFRYVREKRLSTSTDERLFATIMACRYVVNCKVEGDFVECGVWRGGNSIIAAHVFRNLGSSKNVWLFDTFAGMSEPTDVDINFRGERAEEKFPTTRNGDRSDWCYSPIEEVRSNFDGIRIPGTHLRFVKGDVARTLARSEELPASISVLRLDTDWYESTRIELETLYPRLTPGGILIVDDYGHWGGARKAVDEYFSRHDRPFLQYIDQTARIGVKLASPQTR
jgi:O-methyltransferase